MFEITTKELLELNELRAAAAEFLGIGNKDFVDLGKMWTANRRAEIERLLQQAEADKPATVLNLNPFPLKINGGALFPDEVPACPAGEPYAVYVIKDTRWSHRDLGSDEKGFLRMEPVPSIPLVLAAEYLREYVQRSDNSIGGVLCYVGDEHPSSFQEGRTVRVPEVACTERGEFYVEVRERDFHTTLAAMTKLRNASILRKLRWATDLYVENPTIAWNLRPIAVWARDQHLIEELPAWASQ
jgi:hypothetical protein